MLLVTTRVESLSSPRRAVGCLFRTRRDGLHSETHADGRPLSRRTESNPLAGSRYYPSESVDKFTLVRLLPNGSVDTTLGGSEGLPIDPSVFGGWVFRLHPNTAQYTSVKLEITENNSPTKVQYRRILGDGTPDVSFGNNGATSITIPQQYNPGFLTANLLRVDEIGQTYLVLLGRTFATTSNIVICRVKPDGTLDESYGQNGWFFRTVQGALQLHRGLYSAQAVWFWVVKTLSHTTSS